MRFQCFTPKNIKHIDPHKWFAWYPVKLERVGGDPECAWLEYVEREQWYGTDDDGMWGWSSTHRALNTNASN